MTKKLKPRTQGDATPVVSTHEQQAISDYLGYMLDRLEKSLNDHKAAQMESPSATLAGQIGYIRAQVSTTKWLLEINKQRKCYAPSEGTRTAGI